MQLRPMDVSSSIYSRNDGMDYGSPGRCSDGAAVKDSKALEKLTVSDAFVLHILAYTLIIHLAT